MRKRLVIGAFAAVVIGVAALVLSQPRKGTVEYHKEEYLRAHEPGFVGERIMRGPSPIRNAYWAWQDKREDFHRQQLFAPATCAAGSLRSQTVPRSRL